MGGMPGNSFGSGGIGGSAGVHNLKLGGSIGEYSSSPIGMIPVSLTRLSDQIKETNLLVLTWIIRFCSTCHWYN